MASCSPRGPGSRCDRRSPHSDQHGAPGKLSLLRIVSNYWRTLTHDRRRPVVLWAVLLTTAAVPASIAARAQDATTVLRPPALKVPDAADRADTLRRRLSSRVKANGNARAEGGRIALFPTPTTEN